MISNMMKSTNFHMEGQKVQQVFEFLNGYQNRLNFKKS